MTLSHTTGERDRAESLLAGPIVVGFDGSQQGRDALELGRQLATLTGGRLVVAVVQQLDQYVVADPVLTADLDVHQSEEADAVVARAADVLGGEEGRDWRRAVVAARSPAHGLHRVVERESAGIAVVGRTHRDGVARAVLGTTAGRLLHGSPCPVAIAPPRWRSREGGLRRIGAGFDGSAESALALQVAADLANRTSTTLDAVTVFERPTPIDPSYAMTQGYTDQMAALRTSLEHRLARALEVLPGQAQARPMVIEGHASETLVGHSAGTDLLVVGSRGYGPLRSVVVGDVATKLATHAESALMVVPRGAGRHG